MISAGQEAERAGRPEEALRRYESALREFPDSAELNATLGNVLRALGRPDEAVAAYRKSTLLKPPLAAAWYNLALTEHELGDMEGAERDYRAALAADPEFVAAHDSLLCLIGMGGAGYMPSDVLAEHRRWAAQHADRFRAGWRTFTNVTDPNRRLCIGYVSPDFRKHAMEYFIEPILEHHDPEKFEITCYSSLPRPDAMTERFRALSHRWRDISIMTDADVAQTVAADGIDLLVDLAGHTSGNRLLLFARKPAPLQFTFLGYPNTTGMAAVDYRITDALADPPGMSDAHYTERLLRLPASVWCYRAPESAPEVGSLPMRANDFVKFGSFNSFLKITEAVIDVWARLLSRVAGSRLLMIGVAKREAQRRLRVAFAARGIDAERLELHPKVPLDEYLAMMNRVDIALDSFPYNGGTTTCHSLWMGVPTVTLAGRVFVSRAGVSLLTNVGLPELIARDVDEYIEIAAGLAADTVRLTSLRSDLRARMRGSPLCDAPQFVADLEQLYRGAWREWCTDQR
jgi:predicted O-linked N-acetylglucosamine transferase (SPINDLY family)